MLRTMFLLALLLALAAIVASRTSQEATEHRQALIAETAAALTSDSANAALFVKADTGRCASENAYVWQAQNSPKRCHWPGR